MNDSAPPPHGAPPHATGRDGQAPLSWQNPGASPYPAPQTPAFNPRQAMKGPAAPSARSNHPAGRGRHPVMAPPPLLQDNLPPAAPSSYAAPFPYAAPAPYPGQAFQAPQTPHAAPPYPGLSTAPDDYRRMAPPRSGLSAPTL